MAERGTSLRAIALAGISQGALQTALAARPYPIAEALAAYRDAEVRSWIANGIADVLANG